MSQGWAVSWLPSLNFYYIILATNRYDMLRLIRDQLLLILAMSVAVRTPIKPRIRMTI
jgi:hypothetical protein